MPYRVDHPMDENLLQGVHDLGGALSRRGERLCTAESCTGGWIGQAVTAVPGSSGWFEGGLVTYSNEAKMRLLGVRARTLEQFGAVSAETVEEMAKGALDALGAGWSVAVSGVAGPDGGSAEKPVGLVWLAWMRRGEMPDSRRFVLEGDRRGIRLGAVEYAVAGLLERMGEKPPV